jgi:predicted Zn-dependent protease
MRVASTTGRPVMDREQLLELGRKVIRRSTVDFVNVTVQHTAQFVTRLANGQVFFSNDGELVQIQVSTSSGVRLPPVVQTFTNQLREDVLLEGLTRCEEILRALPTYHTDSGMRHESLVQDTPMAVHLWHDSTVEAIRHSRESMIPDILQRVRRAGLDASGFIGLMARAEAVVRRDGNLVFASEETDCEVNVVARDIGAKSIGWGGAAARDWSKLDCKGATERAIEMATLGRNPVAVEPGRRTAIFTPAALAPMLAYFSVEFDGAATKRGDTALSKSRSGGVKWGQQVLDARIKLNSDPADPDGGYRPYMPWDAVATPAMTWVENGVLRNLAFGVGEAMSLGKPYAEKPFSFRMSGGERTIEQMIASCEDGILVNRTSDVDVLDTFTCVMTGTTNGGCFLIKNGKISKPVKNLRFLDSPFFFLNKIEAMGTPVRAAFGYLPDAAEPNWRGSWPRPPVIVPPIMVRDFNFSQLADAV